MSSVLRASVSATARPADRVRASRSSRPGRGSAPKAGRTPSGVVRPLAVTGSAAGGRAAPGFGRIPPRVTQHSSIRVVPRLSARRTSVSYAASAETPSRAISTPWPAPTRPRRRQGLPGPPPRPGAWPPPWPGPVPRETHRRPGPSDPSAPFEHGTVTDTGADPRSADLASVLSGPVPRVGVRPSPPSVGPPSEPARPAGTPASSRGPPAGPPRPAAARRKVPRAGRPPRPRPGPGRPRPRRGVARYAAVPPTLRRRLPGRPPSGPERSGWGRERARKPVRYGVRE